MIENSIIKILHISDLHIGIENDPKKQPLQEKEKRDIIIQRFFEKLKDNTWFEPNFIVISGDIAWSALNTEYEDFKIQFAEKFKDIYKTNFEFVLCPGNHDIFIDEKNEEKIREDIANKVITQTQIDIKLEKSLTLDNFPHMCTAFNSFSNLCNEVKSTKFELIHPEDNYLTGYKYFPFQNLCFVSLNSAWNSKKIEGKGTCVLGRNYVSNIYAKIRTLKKVNPALIVVTLVHHSPDFWRATYLHGIQGEACAYDEIIEFSDIILSGHEHGAVRLPDRLSDSALLFKCGALYAKDIEDHHKYHVNSFNMYSIDTFDQTIDIHPFKLDPNLEKWVDLKENRIDLKINIKNQFKKSKDYTEPEIITPIIYQQSDIFQSITETIYRKMGLTNKLVDFEDEIVKTDKFNFLPVKANLVDIRLFINNIENKVGDKIEIVLYDTGNEEIDSLIQGWDTIDYLIKDKILCGNIKLMPFIINFIQKAEE